MESKLIYRNDGVVKRTSIVDDGILRVFTEVDMESTLESVKRDRELHPVKSNNKLVARVPMTVMEQSIHEQWDDNDWKKWLNDPDNAAFRIWRGRV